MRPLTAVFPSVGNDAASAIGLPQAQARFFHSCPPLLRAAALALALLAATFTAHSQNYTASSDNSTSTITISSGNHTISVGSSGALTRSNAITLSGGTLQGGIMDNVASVSNLSGAGTSSTFVDANGVTIILRGNGTSATTANLTLASGITINGTNQLLVGGGAGGGGARGSRNRGGGGGGGFVVLTTGNLTGTLALTAGGGGTSGYSTADATLASGGGAGNTSSIGATTALGGTGGAKSADATYVTGKGGNSSQTIGGTTTAFIGGNGSNAGNANGGGGGGAGSSANGANGVSASQGGAGGNGTQITTGVVGLSTYMGGNTFGGGGGGGAQNTSGGAGGSGGGGSGSPTGNATAGTSGFGGGGGGGGGTGGTGGAGGAGSVAIQYAYDSNVAAGNLTLSGGITLSSTSTLDAVRSGGLIDITTTGISGTGDLNIASSASSGGVVRFSVANTYSGTTTINSGATLQLANVNALQNTTLDTGTSGSQVVSFTVAGANTYNIGAIQGGDTLDFGANTISVGSNNATTSFTGILAGSGGSLTKEGTGTLTLSGNNTYSGTTTISAGTLRIENVNALQNTTLDTGTSGSQAVTFTVAGANTYNIGAIQGGDTLDFGNNTISVGANNATTSFTGTLAGSGGSLTKAGTGTLTLSGASSSYDGTTMISAGTILIDHANALGSGGNITFSGGGLKYGTGITSDLSSRIKNSGAAMLVDTNGESVTWGTAVDSTNYNGLTKNGTGTLTLSGANTYTGTTTISAGTLQLGAGGTTGSLSTSSSITVNGTLAFNRSDNITQGTHFSTAAIGGTGSIVQNGAGTLTLNAANNYSGGTTLNTGTLVIGHAAAAGTGTITQTSGSSLLKFDTTGTITNTMSVYNVLASQSATLSGAITVNNATWDIETGDTLTISGGISGSGGMTKNGTGTLILSGSNSYAGATVVNAGTLNAANANALGTNNTVQVTGGTLLVTADDAINGKNITMSTNTIGLQFSGTYSGAIGSLTLSANSIIDLGAGSVQILFQGLNNSSNHTLSFYNWSGTVGGNGTADTDKVYFGPDLSDAALAKIYFYTGAGDSFLGSGFDLGLKPTGFAAPWNEGYQIIPGSTVPVVPEPETYATGLLLLLGGAVWMWKRKPKAV